MTNYTKMSDTTNYIAIENAEGTISFTCLYKPNSVSFWRGTQALTFKDKEGNTLAYWDWRPALRRFFKDLKRDKRDKQLIKLCEKNNLSWTDTTQDLLDIYKEIKRFGLLKKKML